MHIKSFIEKKVLKKRVYLYRILIVFLGFIILTPARSQQVKIENLPFFDNKEYHFGFFLGVNQMLFTVKTKPDFQNEYYLQSQFPEYNSDIARVLDIGVVPTYGFNVGIISDLKLSNHFNLRFTPELQFGERILAYDIEYIYRGNTDTIFGHEKRISSTLLNFPLTLKYKGNRINNMRPYLLLGGKLSMDLGAQATKTVNANERDITVKLFRDDVYAEAGVGFDFYFNWFKMSTEIKMSYGLSQMMLFEKNIWADPIQSISSKVFQFNLTFE